MNFGVRKLDGERQQARAMRRNGASVRAIARDLQVAKSSVSVWVRDIALSPEQVADLNQRMEASIGALPELGGNAKAERARARRREWQEQGRQEARRGSDLHRAACMPYWDEGSKGRHLLRLTNPDPAMLRLFIRFVDECYDALDKLQVRVQYHAANGVTACEVSAWWCRALDVDRDQIAVNSPDRRPRSATNIRRLTLPYGVAHVQVHSTELVQRTLGAIQEYGQFERPEWLV